MAGLYIIFIAFHFFMSGMLASVYQMTKQKSKTKEVTVKSPAIMLNREQIGKLNEIVNHFKEIKHFTIRTESLSGIGVGIQVSFDLFEENDTTVDITDVKEW